MKLKTLKTNGERTKKVYDGFRIGHHCLYPNNTKRIVISYFLFPKNLNGEKRRGLQFVEQRSSIDIADPASLAMHYNLWKDEKFINFPSLESKLK